MSNISKYANLPDIVGQIYLIINLLSSLIALYQDTAPDVYESEEPIPHVSQNVSQSNILI